MTTDTQTLDTSAFPSNPYDELWGDPPWPEKIRGFEPHQATAILQALDAYNRGVNLVVLDAPTGSGKTVIAEAIRRLLRPKRALYVANTNSLLDQFMRDFGSYAKALKGRSNYPTFDSPDLFAANAGPWADSVNAGDCNLHRASKPACSNCDPDIEAEDSMHCDYCHPWIMCPYQVAKRDALNAPLTVTNTAYFVTESNGPGGLTDMPFVVVDECDTLESIMLSFAEVNIGERRRKALDIEFPEKKTVEETWVTWCRDEAIPKVAAAIELMGKPRDRRGIRELTSLTRLAGRLTNLEALLKEGNAVYDGYDRGEITFKPIRVNKDAPALLWKHGKQWLAMSATIVDPLEFVQGLGVEEAGLKWELVTVPSTFPKENRPIVVKRGANMVWKERETAWPKMVEAVKAVLTKHPDDRTLVHTVSYNFSQFVFDGLRQSGRPVLVYSDAKERESVLATYRATPGAVLLAPSMDRGIDLPGDECRVQIVTKMPFLSTKDHQVQRRMYSSGGQLWYSVSTIRSLIQMTGRGVRSNTDTCTTYILDAQFLDNVWRKNRGLFPKWWTDALDFSGQALKLDA